MTDITQDILNILLSEPASAEIVQSCINHKGDPEQPIPLTDEQAEAMEAVLDLIVAADIFKTSVHKNKDENSWTYTFSIKPIKPREILLVERLPA